MKKHDTMNGWTFEEPKGYSLGRYYKKRMVRMVNRLRVEDKEAGRICVRDHLPNAGKGSGIRRKEDGVMDRKETPQERYNRKNTKLLQIRLNKNTDADIMAKLEQVESKAGYIKALIRADLETAE